MRVLYDLFYKIVRVYLLHSIWLFQKPDVRQPAIFIANHEQSYGPVTAMASLPKPLSPWVTHEIIDPALCPTYIEGDFVRPEVHLKPPLSTILSRIIGRICVALMKDLKAIPVYRQSRRIAETIRTSVRFIEQGKRLLIFPEIKNQRWNDIINEFDTGFIGIARKLFEKTQEVAAFFPVAVNRRLKELRLGPPVLFDPTRPYHAERARIRDELMERICAMYREMEGEQPIPAEEPLAVH